MFSKVSQQVGWVGWQVGLITGGCRLQGAGSIGTYTGRPPVAGTHCAPDENIDMRPLPFSKQLYQFWETGTQYDTHSGWVDVWHVWVTFPAIKGGPIRPSQSHISSSQLALMGMKCALGVIHTIRPSTSPLPPSHNPLIRFTSSLLDAKFLQDGTWLKVQKWNKVIRMYSRILSAATLKTSISVCIDWTKTRTKNETKQTKAFWNLEDKTLSHGCLGEGKIMGGGEVRETKDGQGVPG